MVIVAVRTAKQAYAFAIGQGPLAVAPQARRSPHRSAPAEFLPVSGMSGDPARRSYATIELALLEETLLVMRRISLRG
jgi:hypothetical protein